MSKPRIVFFGTGPVSLHCLEGIQPHFEIEAVITKPDREVHGKLHDHPVKAWAQEHTIPVHQVASKHELSQLFATHKFASTVGLVVDFGIIIARDVIDAFPRGIVNSHFSLLPQWRGADPISFALLSGQPVTGVSLMLINERMDEGPLIAQEKFEIPPGITNPELADALGDLSNRMLADTLPRYLAGDITPWPQDPSATPTYSRKLTKEDGIIDWTKPAEVLEREIRTFQPWPGSRTTLGDKDVIITQAHAVPVNHPPAQPGDIDVVSDAGLIMVECGNGTLCIDRLKPVGKKEMTAAEFLRGHRSIQL